MSYVDQNRGWFSYELMFVIGSSIKVKDIYIFSSLLLITNNCLIGSVYPRKVSQSACTLFRLHAAIVVT